MSGGLRVHPAPGGPRSCWSTSDGLRGHPAPGGGLGERIGATRGKHACDYFFGVLNTKKIITCGPNPLP